MSRRRKSRRRRLLAEMLEDRRLLAAIVWTGQGGDSAWINANNWDLRRIPSRDDDVLIPDLANNDNVTFYGPSPFSTETIEVASIQVESGASLYIYDDRLKISGESVVDGELIVGSDRFSSLEGDGLLHVNNRLRWQARGHIAIDLTVGDKASATITVGSTNINASPIHGGGSITNLGHIELVGEGYLYQRGTAAIENFATFKLPGGAHLPVDGGGSFHNHASGQLIKTGVGYSHFGNTFGNGVFNNDGLVEIHDGSLAIIRDQISSGRYELSPTAHLIIHGGTHDFTTNSAIVGDSDGTSRSRLTFEGQLGAFGVDPNPSRVKFGGIIDVPEVRLYRDAELRALPDAAVNLQDVKLLRDPANVNANPALIGESIININNTLEWEVGRVGGLVTIAEEAQATIFVTSTSLGQSPVHTTGTLKNLGTIAVSGSGYFFQEGTAILDNLGTFILPGDAHLPSGGGVPTFHNHASGKLIKTGEGSSHFGNQFGNGIFNNAGSVELQGGAMAIIRDQTSSGRFELSPSSHLIIHGGTHDFTATSAIVGSTDDQASSLLTFEGQLGAFGVAPNPSRVNFAGQLNVPRVRLYRDAELRLSEGSSVELSDVRLLLDANNVGLIPALLAETNISIGDLLWEAGRLGGFGQSTITLTGVSSIRNLARDRTFLAGNLTNSGKLVWEGSESIIVHGAPTFTNESTGEFEIGFAGLITGGQLTFVNRGTLRQLPSSGQTQIQVLHAGQFTNEGNLEVGSGSNLLINSNNGKHMRLDAGQVHVDGMLRMFGGGDIEVRGGTITGSGTLYSDRQINQFAGTINPGNPLGKLTIRGHYLQQPDATLAVQIAGLEQITDHDLLHVTGNATLQGQLRAELSNGFLPSNGERFTVLTTDGTLTGQFSDDNLAGRSLSLEQNPQEITLVGQPSLPELLFDLGTIGQLLVAQSRLLDEPSAHGAIAELSNLRLDLLPDASGQPLFSVFIDQAIGLDTDGVLETVEGFVVDGATVEVGDLLLDAFDGPVLSLGGTSLTFDQFTGYLNGETSGDISLTSLLPAVEFDAIEGALKTILQVVDDDSTSTLPLSGNLNLASSAFELLVDAFEVDMEGVFQLEGKSALLTLDATPNEQQSLLTVAEADLTLSVFGAGDATLSAQDLHITYAGDVSISEAAIEYADSDFGETIAGILPWHINRISMAGIENQPIELRDFSADVTVDGYFASDLFDGLPFVPTISIEGNEHSTGPENTLSITHRVHNGVLSPWDAGPIVLGLQSVSVLGLSLDGEIKLGGYQRGEWNQELEGFLTVVAVEDDPQLQPFLDLRFDILPNGSALSFGDSVFEAGSELRVLGQLTLDSNFQGSIGGIELAGATLGVELTVTASPTTEFPFVSFASTVELGELSLREVTVEVENLGSVTSSLILFDLNPDDLADPIGRVASIVVQPFDNVYLSGLDAGRVEVFGALLYRDRLVLESVEAKYDGVIRWTGNDEAEALDLLLVEELSVVFENVVFEGDFSQLLDLDLSIPSPFITASFDELNIKLDRALLLPESDNPDNIPEVTDGSAVTQEMLAGLAGAAFLTNVQGTVSGSDGTLELHIGNLQGNAFDVLFWSASDVSLRLDPAASAEDPLLSVATAAMTLPIMDRDVTLAIHDLQVTQAGEISMAQAQATGGSALSTFPLVGLLPVLVDTVEIEPLTGENRIVINRDTNGDGFPEPEFDIRLQGDFNTAFFNQLNLHATARIGDGAENSFDATFRVTERNGQFQVVPWQTGPIHLSLLAGVDETGVGLSFDGDLTLGGYENGDWNPVLSGMLASSATLLDDHGTIQNDLTIELLDGSSLSDGNLTLNTQVQFDATASGTYLGMELSELTLGFQMVLTWGYTNQAPHVYLNTFEVHPGEVSLSQLVIDIENVGKLTIQDLMINPNAPENAPLATITNIVLDLSNNSLLSSFGTTIFQVSDSTIFHDRLRFGSVAFLLDGTVRVGDTELLILNDLMLNISGLEIGGSFSPNNLNQTLNVAADTPLLAGSLDEMLLSVQSATILPNSDVTAGVEGLLGHISAVDGSIELSAQRVWGEVFDVFSFDSDPVTIIAGPAVPTETPFLEVAGTTSLGLTLIDDKTIEIYTNDFQISQSGVVSISAAGIEAERGLLRSIGLAEGLLPFDLTAVELAAPQGSRLSLNDLDLDAELYVAGFIDLSLFDDLPFKPVVSLGDQSTGVAGQENPFELTFEISRNAGDLFPKIRLVETGLLTLGIADFQVGPFMLHGRDTDGNDDRSVPATVTLGRYSNGVWLPEIGLDVGVGWDGLDASGNSQSSLAIDGAAGVQIETSELRRVSSTKTEFQLDASLWGSLGLGNLPFEADEPTEGGWGFRFQDLGLNFELAFAIHTDNTGVRLEALDNSPIVKLNGLTADSIETNMGGLVNMAATNVTVDLSVFSKNAQGEIISNGPFLTFGGERPVQSIVNSSDMENVDGAIEVTVGFAGMGLGGKAGNFGIGWNPNQVNFEPEAFSLGLEFFQLPGFFLALVQPQGSDDNRSFNFGMDWFPINIEEIGLRFKDLIDPDNLEPFLELLPGGGDSQANPGGEGIVERAASFGMNLLQQVDLLFSGGFDSSVLPLIGELIDLNGEVQKVEVDIAALMSCSEYVWDQRHTFTPELRALMEDVQNNPGVEVIGGRLLAMGALGATLFSRNECAFPIKGFDAIDGGAGLSLGPIDIGGGLGFGLLDFDKNGDAADGDESKVFFFRVEGQFVYDNIGLGAEVVFTEYGPILGRLIAGAPIPIGTLIGAVAGTVVPGPGNAVGAGIGSMSGFMLNGLQGGIVFDAEPLPVIENPIELIENFEIQVPLDLDLNEIRAATEKLFRNADGSVRTDAQGNPSPRNVWDSGFTLAVSGFLTNTYVANQIGMNITLGMNVGYELPDYKLPGGVGVVEALRTGQLSLDDLPGSFGVLTGVSQATLNTALDAFENPGELSSWDAFAAALANNASDQFQLDIGGFLRGFPFGMQLYGLGDLEVFGFPIGGVAAMLDFSDPINPKFDLAGQLPKSGTLLGTLFPAQGEFELQLKSDGLVEGAVVAIQAFLDKVFASDVVGGTLAAGGAYFEGFFNRLVDQLNELPESPLAQFLKDGLSEIPVPFTLDFLRDRLLGRNGLPGIFSFDLSNSLPSLDAVSLQQAALVAANLMRQLLSPDATTLGLLEDSLPDDPQFQSLLQRAEAAIFDPLYGLAAVSNPSSSSLERARELIDGATPQQAEDPVALAMFKAYQGSVGGIKAQLAFVKALGEVILDAGEEAATAYFDTINPSLLFRGGIQPTILGIPLSETGLNVPGVVSNIEESFSLSIDKHGIAMEADVALVDKLLRIMGLPLPIYDRINMSVNIPTENLFRDLALYRPWVIDPTRDWRGTFLGTVGVGYGGLGFDLGDVGGLVFPAVGPAIDPTKPREGLPEDHPLMTKVHIINPNTPTVPDRIQVTHADFLTMREHGGLLLDGRLTVPQYLSDPLKWFNGLKDQIGSSMPMCVGQANLLDCFMDLEQPQEYLDFFTTLYDASLALEDTVSAESQLSQVQLYVPNVFQEISQLVDVSTAGLQTQIYTIFDKLADGNGTLSSDINELIADDIFSQNAADVQSAFQDLLSTLQDHAYLKGVVGTAVGSPFPTSKLFGIDFGGAMLEVADGKLVATGFFPPLQPGETPQDYEGLRFDALIDLQDKPGVNEYPRAGASIRFGTSASTVDPELLQTFLAQSGLAQLPYAEQVGDAFAQVGDWLFSGVAQDVSQIELHVYTPGYDPTAKTGSPLVNRIQQEGGLAVTSELNLSNAFGSIYGDIAVGLLADSDSPLGVNFVGTFAGGGSFSFRDPFGITNKVVTFDLPSVAGAISPAGCVSVALDPNMNIPIVQPITLRFGLAPGACDIQLVLSDLSVPEPPGDEQTTVNIPVRLEQIPTWESGELVLKYQVEGSAEYGSDFLLLNASGNTIPVTSNSWRYGELLVKPDDVQVDSLGERFVEKSIPMVLLGDGSVAPDALGSVDVKFSLIVGAIPPQLTLSLNDPDLYVVIEDTDFVVPIRPAAPAVFYDFDDSDSPFGFSVYPDETSTLDYLSFAEPSFVATHHDGGFPIYFGLPDTSDAPAPGLAYLEPQELGLPLDATGLPHGFQFNVEVDRFFHPDFMEFWDKPIQFASDDNGTFTASNAGLVEEWEVYAMVNGGPPILLDATHQSVVSLDFIPNAHPDLIGWRKNQFVIGERLRQPVLDTDAVALGPQMYFSSDTTLTFRLVPIDIGSSAHAIDLAKTHRRVIDNVVLTQASNLGGGTFGGRNISFDDFINGRVQFDVLSGPGEWQIVFGPPDPGVIDPVPFEDMTADVYLWGADDSTVVSVTDTRRDSDLEFGLFYLEGGAKLLDLSDAGIVRADFAGAVRELRLDGLAPGSSIRFNGTPSETLLITSQQPLGDGSRNGIVVEFPGTISLDIAGMDGGHVDVGAVSELESQGDFSAVLEMQRGFQQIDVQGDFSSPIVRTGLGRPIGDGDSGDVKVEGSIHINRFEVDGDLGKVTTVGGGIYLGQLNASSVDSIAAETLSTRGAAADIRGHMTLGSLEVLATVGGDIDATLVTRDQLGAETRISARPDSQGRGGSIISRNSFYLNGPVALIDAWKIDANIISNQRIGLVIVGAETEPGSWDGNLKAAQFGSIEIFGVAGGFVAATDSLEELAGQAAIERFTVSGTMRGGAIQTAYGTRIQRLEIRGSEEEQGLLGAMRIDGDIQSLQIDRMSGQVVINGQLNDYEIGQLMEPLIISGQHVGAATVGEVIHNGRVIVDGIPSGERNGGRVRGRVFTDIDRNAIQDEDESANIDMLVQLLDSTGVVIAESRSFVRDWNRNGMLDLPDEDGWFQFSDLPQGNYSLRVDVPDAWMATNPDQPLNVTSGGEAELIDLGVRLIAPWNNWNSPLDVNRDNLVTPLDILLIINYLNAGGSVIVPYSEPQFYLDTSGDNLISALDIIRIINFLNQRIANGGEGESPSQNEHSIESSDQYFAEIAAVGGWNPMESSYWEFEEEDERLRRQREESHREVLALH